MLAVSGFSFGLLLAWLRGFWGQQGGQQAPKVRPLDALATPEACWVVLTSSWTRHSDEDCAAGFRFRGFRQP